MQKHPQHHGCYRCFCASTVGADAQKHPQLAVILRHISVMVPYPEVTVRKRFSKCTKQNFPCLRSPSGDTVPRAVDQSEALLQTKISCCMSTNTIACSDAWRNHPKRNVSPILQTRSCMLLQLQLSLENKFYFPNLAGK